jgi:hypothetical protein
LKFWLKNRPSWVNFTATFDLEKIGENGHVILSDGIFNLALLSAPKVQRVATWDLQLDGIDQQETRTLGRQTITVSNAAVAEIDQDARSDGEYYRA